jgi:hypothetical protein
MDFVPGIGSGRCFDNVISAGGSLTDIDSTAALISQFNLKTKRDPRVKGDHDTARVCGNTGSPQCDMKNVTCPGERGCQITAYGSIHRVAISGRNRVGTLKSYRVCDGEIVIRDGSPISRPASASSQGGGNGIAITV